MTKIIITGSFICIIHYSDKRILKSIYSSGTKRCDVETNVSWMCHLPPLSIQIKSRTTDGANGESTPHHISNIRPPALVYTLANKLTNCEELFNTDTTTTEWRPKLEIISNHSDYFPCPSRILPIYNILKRKTLQTLFCQAIKQTSHSQTAPFRLV